MLAHHPYFRAAIRGALTVGIRICGRRSVTMRVLDSTNPGVRLPLKAEWV